MIRVPWIEESPILIEKMKNNETYLFLVVIGGKAPNANIELHDVRWVIGSKIEDTFESLRNNWFGSTEGLHIDSYKKIKSVDGYKIILKNKENEKIKNTNSYSDKKKKLWFVNLGGYHENSMQEIHEFGLVVAANSFEAKKLAKSKWLLGYSKIHKDNICCLKKTSIVDDCAVIKNIDNWQIELILEDDLNEETNNPDWFGYMRIDK